MKPIPGKYFGVLLLLCIFGIFELHSQSERNTWQKTVDAYIDANQPKKADSVLQKQQETFLQAGQPDSLYQFPGKIGRITKLQYDAKTAAAKAEAFISYLKTKTNNPRTLSKAYLDIDKLYVFLIDDQNALKSSLTALQYAKLIPDLTQEELGKINYAIGGNYYALYDLANALQYFKASASAYERSAAVKKDILADAYNGVAVSMWTLNKLDSARIYFKKAISATEESDLTGFNRTYYIVAFQFNLALVIDAQGQLGEAIAMKEEIIKQLQKIINECEDDFLVTKSKRLLASAISNLAAFYNDTGYLTKAYEMLRYAYEKKKEVYEIHSPRLATVLTQIALTEFELKEFDKSIATASAALENLKKSPSDYLSVEADLYAMLGKSHAAKGEIDKADSYFKTSLKLFRKAYPEAYSQEFLIFLRDYSQFLADHGKAQMAIDIAQDAYRYIFENEGAASFSTLKEVTNLSEVYYKAADYENALEWAQKGKEILDLKLKDAKSDIDSVQVEFRRPAITLMEVRSLYRTNTSRDSLFLKQQIEKLNKAVTSLEKRKTTTFSPEDINMILEEYKALSTESKKMYFELFELSGDKKYLDKTVAIHESGIYNRIRTQFNVKNDISFGSLPDSVLKKENELKTSISSALSGDSSNRLENYLKASQNWRSFLDTLKQKYPKYYDLRYATIEEDLGDIQQKIPENTTIVRYFFIENDLFVFILNRNTREIRTLNYDHVKEHILNLAEDQSDLERTSTSLAQLYDKLWRPIEDLVSTRKVVIIPDRDLFNLSFETLSPVKITHFKQLATQSLLAQKVISYSYSLFLLKQPAPTYVYPKNFVAFAPEFNEDMKLEYRFAITDSLDLDKTYIKLLPQPFSTELVKKYAKIFDGESFLNKNSTKEVFKLNAREHKIIHIGTHAESNNITPEFSRLIFAKDVAKEEKREDNSLFTYEIYDYNVASNLTILTACETGKPTFEPGEGMISLAHAFNYAGSESILTSLWKIDEKSSNEILGYFYDNLKDGMPKDEALRQAKLSYLAVAKGRTIAPQYWSGLVLMGDPSPLELHSEFPFWPWFLGGLVILAVMLFVFREKDPTK